MWAWSRKQWQLLEAPYLTKYELLLRSMQMLRRGGLTCDFVGWIRLQWTIKAGAYGVAQRWGSNVIDLGTVVDPFIT